MVTAPGRAIQILHRFLKHGPLVVLFVCIPLCAEEYIGMGSLAWLGY